MMPAVTVPNSTSVPLPGVADDNGQFADLQCVGIAQRNGRGALGRGLVELQNGDVGALIRADQRRVHDGAVQPFDLVSLALVDDVVVGEDVAALALVQRAEVVPEP